MTTALYMTGGDEFQFDITVTDQGVAVDLTGLAMTVSFRKDPSDSAPLFTKTQASGVTMPTIALGNVARVTISPADTSSFLRYQSTVLYWDAQLTVSALPYTVDSGSLTIAVD